MHYVERPLGFGSGGGLCFDQVSDIHASKLLRKSSIWLMLEVVLEKHKVSEILVIHEALE